MRRKRIRMSMWCAWFAWQRMVQGEIDHWKDIVEYSDMTYKAYWWCRNREEG